MQAACCRFAGVTVDAGKAVMWIAAIDETPDDLLLHRAPQPARFAEFARTIAGQIHKSGYKSGYEAEGETKKPSSLSDLTS